MTAVGVVAVFLGKTSANDGIGVDAVDDSPGLARIDNAEFMTPATDDRHWTRGRHTESFAALKPTEQHTSLDARGRRERRRLDLAVQPNDRLVGVRHADHDMSQLT